MSIPPVTGVTARFFRFAGEFFELMRRRRVCEIEVVRIAVLIVCAAGCQSYQPGSFSHARDARTSARATVGCLDVAVERYWDAAAVGPTARVAVANRCDRAVEVDLGAIRASGRTSGGARVAHAAYDPRAEIRPALLDGRSVAAEVIEYRPVAGDVRGLDGLCLDVSAIAGGERAGVGPLCVTGELAIAEVGR